MQTVLNHTRDGRPVLYPVAPDPSATITSYLRMTALGRHVLQVRADAAGRRVEPIIPRGMSVATRDALLEQTTAGRSLLSRERQP